MKIKELPVMERPYEKLEAYGAKHLSNAELLAIIIKNGTKEKTALEIAQELLKEDKFQKGVSFLGECSLQELMKQKGIGRVKAIMLKALAEIVNRNIYSGSIIKKKVSSPEDVYLTVSNDFRGENKEIIKTIILDNYNRIIGIVQNAVGSGNSSFVEAKEIFREPIKVSASGVIVVHNHPSGVLEPSSHDIDFTKQMKKAGDILGISLVDHIIISDRGFLSLKRLGKF